MGTVPLDNDFYDKFFLVNRFMVNLTTVSASGSMLRITDHVFSSLPCGTLVTGMGTYACWEDANPLRKQWLHLSKAFRIHSVLGRTLAAVQGHLCLLLLGPWFIGCLWAIYSLSLDLNRLTYKIRTLDQMILKTLQSLTLGIQTRSVYVHSFCEHW